MVGTVAGANQRFQNAAQQASAHYGVGLNGLVVQWVRETDTAWHAGVWEVNLDSIGIEHEDNGNYNAPRTDALYAASAALVADICKRYGIPITHTRIGASGELGHRECGYATACPDALDLDRIIRQAASDSPTPTQAPTALPAGWWGAYTQGADRVVILPSMCRAPVYTTGGRWYRGTTPITSAAVGEYAEWVLANRIGGTWYVMDESGGPNGQGPMGRLAPTQAYWIEDSVTDSTECGGTDPESVAQARGGQII
jgi:hypothetical protein